MPNTWQLFYLVNWKRSFLFEIKDCICFVNWYSVTEMRAPLGYGILFLPDSIGQSKWIVYFLVVSGQLMIAENLYGHFLCCVNIISCISTDFLVIIYFGEEKNNKPEINSLFVFVCWQSLLYVCCSTKFSTIRKRHTLP